jgi:phosphoesterase RecJ-like protein
MNTFSADCLRLQGYALADKMQIFADKGASLITLTLDELEHYHYKKGDTEGLVNKPLSIPGVYWSIFMREEKEYVKVSARSRGDFSVNDICMRYFNGGGHKNAAGGEFYGPLADAIDVYFKILEEIK